MRASLKTVLIILLYVVTAMGWASDSASWFSKGENTPLRLRVDLFLSSTCPHCQKEDAFFRELQAKKPWLDVNRYEINQGKAALEQFHQQLRQLKVDDYSVPAVFFFNSRWVGFDKPETTGKALARGLDYCYQQITKTGQLNRETTTVLKQWANSNFFAANVGTTANAAVFIPLMSLTDALASCSIFTVLALFAFLWLHKEKYLMLGLGTLFIVIVAVVHHFQQDHTIFFYQVLNGSRMLTALVGLGLIAYVFIIYSKGSTIKLGFTIPILVGLTAFSVEAYQQTCLPNYALIFTQWLDLQQISPQRREFYLFLYGLFYILPLAALMAGIIYCRIYKKMEKYNLLLICTAWCLLLIIGILLVTYPKGIASLLLSVLALILSLVAAKVTLRKPGRFMETK